MPEIISNTGPASLNISQSFAWNIAEYLQCSKTFGWTVGEGPLFWYKIEWKKPICPPQDCTPSVSVCSLVQPTCNCATPSEVVTGCDMCEIWHVQATSIQDLCRRLNRECCNRNLFQKKVFKKVSKYGRPVLCCDVENYIISKIPIVDDYLPVDYCVCECISWLDPCDPACGGMFVTPCDDDVPYKPCQPASQTYSLSTTILFGLPKIEVPTKPGFDMTSIQVMKPQVDSIMTKCGILPSNLKIKHNLAKASILKEFIARNKLQLSEEMDLVYNKTSSTWQKTIHLNGHNEKWTMMFSLACSDDADAGNYGWKSHTHITKQVGTKKLNTRILVGFTSHGKLDGSDMFGVNYNYNTNTGKVTAMQPVIVKNKTITDEIGLFRGDWAKDPYLSLKISVDKKG